MTKFTVIKSKANHIGECNFCRAGTDLNGSLSTTETIYLITALHTGLQFRCCSECLKELKKIRLMRTMKA